MQHAAAATAGLWCAQVPVGCRCQVENGWVPPDLFTATKCSGQVRLLWRCCCQGHACNSFLVLALLGFVAEPLVLVMHAIAAGLSAVCSAPVLLLLLALLVLQV